MMTSYRHSMAGWAGILVAASAFCQGLKLEPGEITIRRVDESVVVALTNDGAPVAAERVGEASFLVDNHNYSRMFHVVPTEGAITITPTELIEMGRYDLLLSTDFGTARGMVHVTLSHDPLTLENRARALDITVDELRERLGLRETLGREDLRIVLPEKFYVGQRIDVSLEPPAVREYLWIVDGQVAASGQGPHDFRYLFKDAGEVSIRYQERQGGELLVDLPLIVSVLDEPALPWEVPARRKLYLPGPEGYTEYRWLVDGVEVSRQLTLRHTFDTPGAYTLECVMSSDAPESKYRKITYAVTAK